MSERILAAPVSSGGLRREVFGFLPYWELTDASTRLDYSVLSTIAYFGVGADKDGHLIKKRGDGSRDVGWAGWTSSALTAGHQRGPRQADPRRADGPALRLDDEPDRGDEGAPGQLGRAQDAGR